MSFGFGFGFPKRLTSGGGLSPRLYLDFIGTGVLPSTVTFSRGTNATLTDSNGRVAWAPHNLLTNSEDFEAAAWSKTNTTATANVGTAPDGTFTADKIAEDATTNPHQFANSPVMSLSTTYTLSIYAKAVERNWIILNIYTGVASCWTWFNVSAGTIGTVGAGATARIESVGNGWFRCSITTTTATSGFPNTAFWVSNADNSISYLGTTGSGILVWGAQLNVANAPVNLLTWSEQFDNAAWTKGNVTVSANSTTAPDGTNTADKIQETNANAEHYALQGISATAASYTFSVYLKAAERTWANIYFVSAGSSKAYFDLANGVVGTLSPGVAATISNAGNGWWRCQITVTAAAATFYAVINPALGDNQSIVYAGTTGSGIFLWGAQLNTGSTALPYVATTSSIYLPPAYNPTTPKNLLGFTQEPENAAWTKSNSYVQQNLLTWSEDFSNAAWALDNGAALNPVVTANAGVAPNGSTTADRIVFNRTGGTFSRIQQSAVSTIGLQYTFSVWMKTFTAGTTANVGIRVDLNGVNCVVTENWTRFTVTTTTTAGSTAGQILLFSSIPGNDLTADVLVWGAQLVQGSTAGDYTQTTSAAAPTRYLNWDGTLTGRKLVENAAAAVEHYLFAANVSIGAANTLCTSTVYVKAAERTRLQVRAYSGGSPVAQASFNLSTLQFSGISGGTWAYQDAGGGWYRISVVATHTNASSNGVGVFLLDGSGNLSYTGDGTSGIYVSDFQLSNSASVDPYVYNPQAAAASAAYYGPRFDYNPTGTPVLGSEILVNGDFSSGITNWANFQSTIVPSAGGVLLTQTAAAGAGQMYYTGSTAAMVGNTVVASLRFSNKTTAQPCRLIIYNVTAGFTEVARATSTASSGVLTCSGVCPAGATFQVTADIANSAIGESVLIDDVSVKPVTGYTATANGLLIEETRTNLLTYSEQLNTAPSVKSNVTVADNAAVSPTGATTASKISGTAVNNIHVLQLTLATSAQTYTFSFYAKAAEYGWCQAAIYDNVTSFSAFVNLSTGAVGTTGGAVTCTTTSVGNGWFRIAITATVAASATSYFQIWLSTANNVTSFAGDGTSGILAFGSQVETGSFATSYIPTVASQVTRNADSASMLGDNFYTWYNPNQGSWSSEFATTNTGNAWVFAVTTSAGQHDLVKGPTTVNYRYGNGVNSDNVLTITLGSAIGKFAGAYTLNGTHAAAINGSAVTTTGVSAAPTETGSLRLGTASGGTTPLNGHIRRIGYYNTRLPDSTLTALTT